MTSSITQDQEQAWLLPDKNWSRNTRRVLEKLEHTQIRESTAYTRLRILVPVVALPLIWLAIHWSPLLDASLPTGKLEATRQVLTAVSMVSLWSIWLSLPSYVRRSPLAALFTELGRLLTASTLCGVLLLIWEFGRNRFLPGFALAGAATASLFLTSALLLSCFALLCAVSLRFPRSRAAIVVGTGPRAALFRALLKRQHSDLAVLGCVDDSYVGEDPVRDKYLGPISALAGLLKTNPVQVVLIALPMRSKFDDIQEVIRVCESIGVESHYLQNIFETARAKVRVTQREPNEVSIVSQFSPDAMQLFKRVLDIAGALLFTVLLSPVMLGAAIAIRLTSPGPILFVHPRYGQHRELFPMFKFRSMVVGAERGQASLEARNEATGPVFKLKSDPRVTPVGAFLRKTSIDELPQLFNVLRGEMSLVGPRPLPTRDVFRFEESWFLRRFSVRPGITCIWQVGGRSNTTFDDWIRQDLQYIDSWSLWLDLKILARTVPAVLRGTGAI